MPECTPLKQHLADSLGARGFHPALHHDTRPPYAPTLLRRMQDQVCCRPLCCCPGRVPDLYCSCDFLDLRVKLWSMLQDGTAGGSTESVVARQQQGSPGEADADSQAAAAAASAQLAQPGRGDIDSEAIGGGPPAKQQQPPSRSMPLC